MTSAEFTAKVYEILKDGLIEVDGKLYYSEPSVMAAMEWVKDNLGSIVEVDTEKILTNFMNKFSI